MRTEEVTKLEPLAVRFVTAGAMLECSESSVRQLAREGRLGTVLVGADLRVTVASIRKFAKTKAVKRERKATAAEPA